MYLILISLIIGNVYIQIYISVVQIRPKNFRLMSGTRAEEFAVRKTGKARVV